MAAVPLVALFRPRFGIFHFERDKNSSWWLDSFGHCRRNFCDDDYLEEGSRNFGENFAEVEPSRLTSSLQELAAKNPTASVARLSSMMTNRNIASSVLLHHYRHNQVLHQNVILLSILTQHSPEVPQANRVRVTEFEHGFFKVVAHYGYMETPERI